jgi:hypothetical protein
MARAVCTDVVVFDSVFLLAILDPLSQLPPDPGTRRAIDRGRQRVEHLIDTLSESRARVLLPSPVLAEVFVTAGSAVGDYIAKTRSVSTLIVADFDSLAAIECAQLTGAALQTGKKRGKAAEQPWQKVKIDRQILWIVLSNHPPWRCLPRRAA